MRIPQIPMEWMDPMSWRLPSGKALAEFALQAGFLAPLMLSSPSIKKGKRPAAEQRAGNRNAGNMNTMGVKTPMEKHAGEGPERSGSFRPPGFGPET